MTMYQPIHELRIIDLETVISAVERGEKFSAMRLRQELLALASDMQSPDRLLIPERFWRRVRMLKRDTDGSYIWTPPTAGKGNGLLFGMPFDMIDQQHAPKDFMEDGTNKPNGIIGLPD